MSAILKFDFQKREQLRFSKVNYLNYTKKTQFACGNYIFPKTRGNKNKPRTHFTPLKLYATLWLQFASLIKGQPQCNCCTAASGMALNYHNQTRNCFFLIAFWTKF